MTDADCVGVRALDDLTLVVELEGPTSYFPYLVTCVETFPVPRHVVQAHGAAWTELANIATNGPFRLAAWERGQFMVLEGDPDYHGRFTGNVQRAELSFPLGEPGRFLRIYEDDNLETFILEDVPQAEWDPARQGYAGEYVSGPAPITYYIGFDVPRPLR